jgi:hypothetical protein
MQATAAVLGTDDALLGIFVFVKRNYFPGRRLELNMHNSQIHEIFMRLREKMGDRRILSRFVFSPESSIPFSPALERALRELQAAEFLLRPDAHLWVLTDSGERYFSGLETSIEAGTLEELARIADCFMGQFRPN